MWVMELAFFIVLVIASIHLWITKRNNDFNETLLAIQIKSNNELKKTLTMGLFYRFNFPRKENGVGENVPISGTEQFLKQTPIEFEDFVAKILENYIGGNAFTTRSSGDYGVDIEHYREDGLYLGQVKAYKDDLSYEPIALIHSNIVKRNAKGGFVITTSSYSKNARNYAEGLGIELIDGIQFVEIWLKTLEIESVPSGNLVPETT
jgi:restriction system protein